ncbi:hypothetical protein HHK36_021281 [Tetracentron sinense]|uniref:Uncharacterized protein n=1 Tax=Tetracentron sinense TaxID=13715 RepID=A0A834YSU5_TETSI|nr:hypothetical protein HHK36_021281 [Tetracentron sinense]
MNPTSICSRILKGIYYPNSDFFKASKGYKRVEQSTRRKEIAVRRDEMGNRCRLLLGRAYRNLEQDLWCTIVPKDKTTAK